MITATVKHFLEHLIITQLQENNIENKHTTLQVKKKERKKTQDEHCCVATLTESTPLFSQKKNQWHLQLIIYTLGKW